MIHRLEVPPNRSTPCAGFRRWPGRLLGPEDDRRGCPSPTVVLGYTFWQSQFAGRLSAIGSRLMVEDHPIEIVGVTPAGFAGPEVGPRFDLALPLCSRSKINAIVPSGIATGDSVPVVIGVAGQSSPTNPPVTMAVQ